MVRLPLSFALGILAFAQSPSPDTPRKPVFDSYHGVRVEDDYRRLENFDDPAVKRWAAQENADARAFLDKLPARQAIYTELAAWDRQRSPDYREIQFRKVFFALKDGPEIQQPVLVTLHSPDDLASERILLDPNSIDSSHTTAIDFFEPSPDGRYVAVSLSHGGSEQGDVRVIETSSGRPLNDLVQRVNNGTAGGSVAWNGDSSGFFYTRYPRGSERPKVDLDFYQQVYFHRLGDAAEKDRYEIGNNFPRVAETVLRTSPDGRYISARVANGDGGEYELFLRGPEGDWKQAATFADEIADFRFGKNGDGFVLSHHGAPRGKVLRFRLNDEMQNKTLADAETIVPEGDAVLEDLLPVESGLYLRELIGGPSRVRFFPFGSRQSQTVPSPAVGAIRELVSGGKNALLFRAVTFLSPPSWYVFDPATGKATETAMHSESPISLASYEVLRDTALSKDGTRIPLSIIRPKSLSLNGDNPVLLTGYGGYDISDEPNFSLTELAMLQQGFTVVHANLRGGGEFGEEWHNAGKLTRKQNVFDDFAAAAQHLIAAHYTSPRKLGIFGGSNGGLLMGAEFTQHPDLFRAVVSFVGIYDMLRVELSPNGAFNVTEFGTVKEADQFRALYAYSPYHHVKDGAQYPAILFITGNNDPRVDPMQSRKMTARLQATGTKQPVLLRTSSSSGHGIGTAKNEQYAEFADAIAFLSAQIMQ